MILPSLKRSSSSVDAASRMSLERESKNPPTEISTRPTTDTAISHFIAADRFSERCALTRAACSAAVVSWCSRCRMKSRNSGHSRSGLRSPVSVLNVWSSPEKPPMLRRSMSSRALNGPWSILSWATIHRCFVSEES